jgi:hypothetical protein
MTIVRVLNPDKERVYHCWHYCHTCKETFMHTQAQCDFHKHHNYTTIPMEKDFEDIEVHVCSLCGQSDYRNEKCNCNHCKEELISQRINVVCNNCGHIIDTW